MTFTACRNSKYFSFYGTLNFSWNGLRMHCFFFLLPTIVPPIFDNFQNRATSMKLGMQFPNNIVQVGFSRNPEFFYFLGRFHLFLNTHGLSRFYTYRLSACRCMPTIGKVYNQASAKFCMFFFCVCHKK